MSISFSQELLISTVLVLIVSLILYFRSSSRSKNPSVLPTNWPMMHMLPGLIANLHNLHDHIVAGLAESSQSLKLHFPHGHMFLTCDQANVRHIFNTNQANFPKGVEFAAIFDIMDGSIYTTDGEPWGRHRSKLQKILSNPRLVASMAACCRDKVENALLPLFTKMASTSTPFDMQDVVSRFVFDLATTPVFGVDPGLLSSDMPPKDAVVAMDTIMEVGFLRHIIPASCWKAMRRLNIGPERKLNVAHTVLQGFIADMIKKKINRGCVCNEEEQEGDDILSSYINDPAYATDDLLRATLLSFMVAGHDPICLTLLWLFYNLAQNPIIVSAIRDELSSIASHKVGAGMGAMVMFETEETKSLVYLRAVLYETLRLYPPAPIMLRTTTADDIMPSGHEVRAGETILISAYSMGRMEDVWGKDCHDFNPHRWLSEDGNKLRYVPSYKYLSFSSGPRICPGKEIAMIQMKTIVSAIVWNFDMEVVKGQSIEPKLSGTLQMKNGLIVKLKKREI